MGVLQEILSEFGSSKWVRYHLGRGYFRILEMFFDSFIFFTF